MFENKENVKEETIQEWLEKRRQVLNDLEKLIYNDLEYDKVVKRVDRVAMKVKPESCAKKAKVRGFGTLYLLPGKTGSPRKMPLKDGSTVLTMATRPDPPYDSRYVPVIEVPKATMSGAEVDTRPFETIELDTSSSMSDKIFDQLKLTVEFWNELMSLFELQPSDLEKRAKEICELRVKQGVLFTDRGPNRFGKFEKEVVRSGAAKETVCPEDPPLNFEVAYLQSGTNDICNILNESDSPTDIDPQAVKKVEEYRKIRANIVQDPKVNLFSLEELSERSRKPEAGNEWSSSKQLGDASSKHHRRSGNPVDFNTTVDNVEMAARRSSWKGEPEPQTADVQSLKLKPDDSSDFNAEEVPHLEGEKFQAYHAPADYSENDDSGWCCKDKDHVQSCAGVILRPEGNFGNYFTTLYMEEIREQIIARLMADLASIRMPLKIPKLFKLLGLEIPKYRATNRRFLIIQFLIEYLYSEKKRREVNNLKHAIKKKYPKRLKNRLEACFRQMNAKWRDWEPEVDEDTDSEEDQGEEEETSGREGQGMSTLSFDITDACAYSEIFRRPPFSVQLKPCSFTEGEEMAAKEEEGSSTDQFDVAKQEDQKSITSLPEWIEENLDYLEANQTVIIDRLLNDIHLFDACRLPKYHFT